MTAGLPLVTIITPTYNGSRYLAETIESVLEQDYPRIEYIVLDDGSTDETPELLERYASKLRVERHPNMDQTRTVNRGFSLASGDIFLVVCDDDPLLPGAVSAGVEALERDPTLVGVYPDWNMIDEHGETIEVVRTWEYSYDAMLRRHHCILGPGALFRRSLVDRIKGRDPQFRYVHDLDFWLRAGLVGSFARIPKVLATFRVHQAQLSGQHSPEMAAEHVRLVEKIFAIPDLPPDVIAARREAFSSAHYIAGCVYGSGLGRFRYCSRAIAYTPELYLTRYRDRTGLMLRGLGKALAAGLRGLISPAAEGRTKESLG